MTFSDSEKSLLVSVAKLCGVVKCEVIVGCIFTMVSGTFAILTQTTAWGGVCHFIFGFSFLMLGISAVKEQSSSWLIVLGVGGILAAAVCILRFVLHLIDLIAAVEYGSQHGYVFVYLGDVMSWGWYITLLVTGVVGSCVGALLFAWTSFDAFRLSRMIKAAREIEKVNCVAEEVVFTPPPILPRPSVLQVDESAQPSQETPPPSFSFVV